jgi:hypothetical protein
MTGIRKAGIVFTVLMVLVLPDKAAAVAEKQTYTVVHSGEGFEIRHYPPAILATVQSKAKTYGELSTPGFRTLAGYIFGGNDSGQKIAMTSPVHMQFSDSLSSMSFVMPSSYEMDQLPRPSDSRVKLERSEDQYVAVLRFGGYASDSRIRHYSEKLKQLLDARQIPVRGPFRYLGYNPPYQIIGRKNEVIVSVEWSE